MSDATETVGGKRHEIPEKEFDEPNLSGRPVTAKDLEGLGVRSSILIDKLQARVFQPNEIKTAPMIPTDRLSKLCGLTKAQLNYRIKNGAEPAGTVPPRGGRREFSVEDVRAWTKSLRKDRLKPEGCRATTVTISFFKGGVCKTTTTMVLGQALNLLGHRVLVIDMDPQGTLTTLFGLVPEQLHSDQTLVDLFMGEQDSVDYAVRKTYWPDLDLIPATSTLFNAEFALPAQQSFDRGFQFWNVLNKGLESVRDQYDIILIDTPPALSFGTINALYAADGLIAPMTSSVLDLASSSRFWLLLSDFELQLQDLFKKLKKPYKPKEYSFVNVLLSRVNNTDRDALVAREWICGCYTSHVFPVDIPLSVVASGKTNEFSTAFDVTRYEGDHRTYKRMRDAYEELALIVERSIAKDWKRQLSELEQ